MALSYPRSSILLSSLSFSHPAYQARPSVRPRFSGRSHDPGKNIADITAAVPSIREKHFLVLNALMNANAKLYDHQGNEYHIEGIYNHPVRSGNLLVDIRLQNKTQGNIDQYSIEYAVFSEVEIPEGHSDEGDESSGLESGRHPYSQVYWGILMANGIYPAGHQPETGEGSSASDSTKSFFT
jgi:hypothetical protein